MTKRPRMRPWPASEISLLGTMTDAGLGKMIGRSANAVANKRQLLKIRPFSRKRKFSQRELRLLGTNTDAVIAKRLKTHRVVVARLRKRYWVPKWDGTVAK